jgi:predicted metal-dependent hydrolase
MFSFLKPAAKPEPELRSLRLADGESVEINWVRDTRARRLRLIVGENGVRLTLPYSASIKLAEAFLFEQRDWLTRQLRKQPRREVRLPFGRGTDYAVLLRDVRVPLTWREGRYARVDLDEDGVTTTLPAAGSDAQARRALKEFYLGQARADIGRWLPKYLPALPGPPKSLKLRALSSLWGSLSPNDDLSLDLSLVLGRPSAFEYVLVHELCHLIHRNHSRRFWREVEARWPEWRAERDYLHGEGLALKSELKRLIA